MIEDINGLLAEIGATGDDVVLVNVSTEGRRAVFVSYNPTDKTYAAVIREAAGQRTVVMSGKWPVAAKPAKKPK